MRRKQEAIDIPMGTEYKFARLKKVIKENDILFAIWGVIKRLKIPKMAIRLAPLYYAKMCYRKIEKMKDKNIQLHFDTFSHNMPIRQIEINKNCNLNCVMCNTSLSKRENIYMELTLFEKICLYLKKIKQNPITLHSIGEPLINPNLEEYFKIARKYGIKIFLSTNGQILNEKLDLLCKYADIIDTLRFSIDGATKETYEKIRRPGKFDKLISNLNYFKKVNRDNKYFRITKIDSIVSTDVKNELAYHLSFYSQYTKMQNIGLHFVNGLSSDNSYFFNSSVLRKHIVLNIPCSQLDNSMNILCDGSVTACCRDYNGDLIYGNISENTPEELINNEKIVSLRRHHNNRVLSRGHACNNCYQIEPKVNALFEMFVRLLVLRNMRKWNIHKMQNQFNRFFELFESNIPTKQEYFSIFK